MLDREVEPSEEGAAPGYAELKTPENWVHLNPNILSSGRVRHIPPVGVPENEEEVAKLVEAEAYIPLLRGINEEESICF